MTALPPGEVEAMRAIGERFLAEVRPFAELEVAGAGLADDAARMLLAAKALDCLLLALPSCDLGRTFAGLGMALGRAHAGQPEAVRPGLVAKLERGFSVGDDIAGCAAAGIAEGQA